MKQNSENNAARQDLDDANLFGEVGVCDSNPNNWPASFDTPEPRISKRPFWRYPNRKDFFELQQFSRRVDWASREIDRHAKRADGLLIWVSQPMTFRERLVHNPRFAGIISRARGLLWWWKRIKF